MAEAARRIDLIDARPAFTEAEAAALEARFAGVDSATMLRELLAGHMAGNVAVVSSFGAESAVLLDLVARADPGVA